MRSLIVRRRVARTFERLTHGEWEAVVDEMADDVNHVFPGDHPLGGERRGRDAVLRWFQRLGRLYPGHEFRLHRVISSGPPWSLWIAAQWTADLRPRAGEPYSNDGAHWLHVRMGKVVYFHAYLDTQPIAAACQEMAEGGIAEAAEPPILS